MVYIRSLVNHGLAVIPLTLSGLNIGFFIMVMDVSSAAAPPSYHRLSRPGQVPQRISDLPAYSRHHNSRSQPSHQQPRRELTEHVFELSEGKSKPWAILTLNSSAKSSKSLPTFFEKENITGKLEVTAERGDSIQAITVTVCIARKIE